MQLELERLTAAIGKTIRAESMTDLTRGGPHFMSELTKKIRHALPAALPNGLTNLQDPATTPILLNGTSRHTLQPSMASDALEHVDTVIVGNGPSALILSYILHGHIPHYSRQHHDALLCAKLEGRPDLLDLTPDLYAHFQSSLRYSTQALPINTLLDTLIRQNADTEVDPPSCVEWRHDPRRAISHVALGNSSYAGGQWAENPVTASPDIGTLSYAEMLSLPGYSYAQHYEAVHGKQLPHFQRPSREEVAGYYKAYPVAVGIADSIKSSNEVANISRTADGFFIASHKIQCKHLVLASGIFSVNIPPPQLLSPIATLQCPPKPILVIGSGFSAADVIISTPPNRKIIHLYHWSPDDHPSPLRGCHHQAYPEYATIYRQMKLAALGNARAKPAVSPMLRKKKPFFSQRDWNTVYEGLANAEILDVKTFDGAEDAFVTLRLESGDVIERSVGGLEYVVGRRGSLAYLDSTLQDEVLSQPHDSTPRDPVLISGRTLREKAETDLEVAPGVFIVGSLTGDSLVRHAFGACAYAAGKIINGASRKVVNGTAKYANGATAVTPPMTPVANGFNGGSPQIRANGVTHQDLHLDRRKLAGHSASGNMTNGLAEPD